MVLCLGTHLQSSYLFPLSSPVSWTEASHITVANDFYVNIFIRLFKTQLLVMQRDFFFFLLKIPSRWERMDSWCSDDFWLETVKTSLTHCVVFMLRQPPELMLIITIIVNFLSPHRFEKRQREERKSEQGQEVFANHWFCLCTPEQTPCDDSVHVLSIFSRVH